MRWVTGSLVGLAALALAGCGRRESPAEAGIRTQTLLIANSAEPADLDPQVITNWPDFDIVQCLFEGLTEIDEKTTTPVPAVAKSWDISPDGLVYTFHLRPESRWSNGDPVRAEDFVYAFHRILTPSFAAIYSYMLWPIKNAEAYSSGKITDFSKVGVEAVDPLTLRISLGRPTPYLPALVAHSSWYPLHRAVIEKFGRFDQKGTRWTRPGNLVGNGAFVLKEWIPNSRIVVEKNPLYWDASHVRLHQIDFFPIEDHNVEEAAFRAGQLHETYGMPSSKIAYYRREHPEVLHTESRLADYYLFVNVTRPPLDNPKLRRALSLDIDRTAIARDVLVGAISPAHSFTPPDCAGYTARAAVPDDFDQARKLMAEAGYPGGRGLPKFEVISYAVESAVKPMEAIQARWARDLGVHVTIRPVEFKTAIQDQQSRDYSIAFSSWIADYPDPSTFLEMMVTGGGNNSAGWSNHEYDRLIDQASNTPDNAGRYALYQRAEAILLQEAPVIPLYLGEQTHLIQTSVHGWQSSKLGYACFKNVWLEK